MQIPRLKSLSGVANGDTLLLNLDPRQRLEVADPTGEVRVLLRLLREGSRTPDELARALAERRPDTDMTDVADVLAQLDALGWLEDAAAPRLLDPVEQERYFSNLAFFDAFTRLDVHREVIQRKLIDSHVVVLGAGGLGSCVLQSLAGFGVGRLTILDHDVVELRNFARQFTYFPEQIGQPKVQRVADWLRAFHPAAVVVPVHTLVQEPDDVRAVLAGADLVVSVIDTPDAVDLWVNEACVGAGVPFIRAGLAYVQGVYWSVDPGRSACRQCLELYRERLAEGPDAAVVSGELFLEAPRVNRGIGPVAQILGGLTALESVRYLTGIAAPVSAGRYQLVDFSGAAEITTDPWPRADSCPICATAPTGSGRAR